MLNYQQFLQAYDAYLQYAASQQQPVQQPMQQPVQQPMQQPVQQPMQQPVQQPMQQPVQQPMQQPVQQPVQQPMQQPMQQLGAMVTPSVEIVTGGNPYISPTDVMTERFNALYGGENNVQNESSGNTGRH